MLNNNGPSSKCKVCGFALTNKDELCSYHSQTYTVCGKCKEVVQKPEIYCVDCIANSKGRCTTCEVPIGMNEEAHLLREPHIRSAGRFICTKCYKEMKPLANISVSELEKIAGKMVSWPLKVDALNDFLVKMHSVIWKESHPISTKLKERLAEITKVIGTFKLPIIITTYPWFILEKYKETPNAYAAVPHTQIQKIAFTGGTTAYRFVRAHFQNILSIVSVMDGLDSGWPANILPKILSYLPKKTPTEIQEAAKILGKALWHPTWPQELDGTLWICEAAIPTVYEEFMKLHEQRRPLIEVPRHQPVPEYINIPQNEEVQVEPLEDTWYSRSPLNTLGQRR